MRSHIIHKTRKKLSRMTYQVATLTNLAWKIITRFGIETENSAGTFVKRRKIERKITCNFLQRVTTHSGGKRSTSILQSVIPDSDENWYKFISCFSIFHSMPNDSSRRWEKRICYWCLAIHTFSNIPTEILEIFYFMHINWNQFNL